MSEVKQQIGKLNQRLAFMTYVTERGERGGVNKMWITSNQIWAAVNFQEAGNDEEFLSGRLSPVIPVVFTVRMREGIQTYMRILYKGDEYQITGLIPRADKAYLEVKAELLQPEQRVRYWTTPQGNLWVDPLGNLWEWKGDGSNEPTKKPYISPGGFTWTDPNGYTWFQNVPS